MTGLVPGLDAHHFGLIEQNAIGNDLGLEPVGAELARHVLGGLVILGRRGQVRLGRESLQLLARQLGIGNREKLLFKPGFAAEVGVTERALRRNSLRRQPAQWEYDGNDNRQKKNGKRSAEIHAIDSNQIRAEQLQCVPRTGVYVL